MLLGRRDIFGVVDFNDNHKLAPMPYEVLVEGNWGSYDTKKEVIDALRRDQRAKGDNNWGNGRFYSDYHDLRMKTEKDDFKDHERNISVRGGVRIVHLGKVAVPTVLGVWSATTAEVIRNNAPGWWKAASIPFYIIAGAEGRKVGVAIGEMRGIEYAVRLALALYTNPNKLVGEYDSGGINH